MMMMIMACGEGRLDRQRHSYHTGNLVLDSQENGRAGWQMHNEVDCRCSKAIIGS